jgi:hypothetical protein
MRGWDGFSHDSPDTVGRHVCGEDGYVASRAIVIDEPDVEPRPLEAIGAPPLGLSRSLLNLAERGGRASYPQFTAARGIPT